MSESTAGQRAGHAILVLFLIFLAVGAAVFGLKSWRAHHSKGTVQEVDEAAKKPQSPEITAMDHGTETSRTSPDQGQLTRQSKEMPDIATMVAEIESIPISSPTRKRNQVGPETTI